MTGAGSGLGRALAIGLMGRGLVVAGLGRDGQKLNETGKLSGSPERFHGFTCDISDFAQLSESFARIRQIGDISILINNAASYPRRDFLDESPASFMETVAINLGGMAACCRLAIDDMIQAGRGRILNVVSFADLAPQSGSSAYSVSKGACRILTNALVADLHERYPKIIISSWAPGILNTQMGATDGLDPAMSARWGVELALSDDPALNGALWERDAELAPPRSLKSRILDRFLMRNAPSRGHISGLVTRNRSLHP
ncbi:SDR family oxidoreductase [Paracoccus sp. MBLB3053]|uniref:SDR family oxidoreductase n=1 Tax=Paracoccus aurantius TaxID=3073814 RepID=A0ABU2HUM6_9RHOB|nr:SDR family oxidoreductase [Paracoccus sp. MBLB3053]MDS9468747.1 SDR family oxidoreductase [Paracoccus sp. MBLB3053]